MDILRKNTIPSFQIVPRFNLSVSGVFRIELRNENTQKKQNIICSISKLQNENFNLFLDTFPTGKIGDKFSYSLFNNASNELVLMGKLIIVSENQDVQNYSNKLNNQYYL
jgi:hypothetical protein